MRLDARTAGRGRLNFERMKSIVATSLAVVSEMRPKIGCGMRAMASYPLLNVRR